MLPPKTIRDWRRSRRMTATQLARRLEVSELDVVRWERGRASPTREMAEALMAIFKMTPGVRRKLAKVVEAAQEEPPQTNRKRKPRGKPFATGGADPRHAVRRRLTEEEVIEIRQSIEVGYSDRELGRIYGVNQATIWSIKLGKTWAWLSNGAKTDG